MISPSDPFIQSQSEALCARVVRESTLDLIEAKCISDLDSHALQMSALRLAEIATIAVYEKNGQELELTVLKDENAMLRKRLLPDGMPREVVPSFGSWIFVIALYGLAIYGVVTLLRKLL